MNDNLFRRVNWLWKHRHTHDGDPNIQEQLTIIRTQVEEQGDTNLPLGAHIHLLATSQSIAVGGEAVEWANIMPVHPFQNFNPTLPSESVQIIVPGYYDIQLGFVWEAWARGGTAWIERTRGDQSTVVWPPGVEWSSPVNRRFTPESAKGVACDAGDLLTAWVDHGDGTAQNLQAATLVVELVDRYRPRITQELGDLLVWTEDDTFDFGAGTLLDVYVVAGGGGGGSSNSSSHAGGGGGAGGVLILTNYNAVGVVNIVVGAGGAGGTASTTSPGTKGSNSSFDGQVAEGGGFGGANSTGGAGGSGGGGGPAGTNAGGAGSQGSTGGTSFSSQAARTGGGGGGYSQAGANATSAAGGPGGNGIDLSSIVGTAWGEGGWFAGGGGGGGMSTGVPGGLGGGGARHFNGDPNTGGGGGGGTSSPTPGGSGGSGIVIAVPV